MGDNVRPKTRKGRTAMMTASAVIAMLAALLWGCPTATWRAAGASEYRGHPRR